MSVKGTYPASRNGNFYVKDSIGVPHPYCIRPRHITIASDRFGGLLGESAIEYAESQGVRCATPGCQLSYKQHEQALVIQCNKDPQNDSTAKEELQEYLLSIKEEAEKNHYAGFVFLK